jgi:hypothetical protein
MRREVLLRRTGIVPTAVLGTAPAQRRAAPRPGNGGAVWNQTRPTAFPLERPSPASFEDPIMDAQTPQPGMAERAIDTATDVSQTVSDVTAALQVAVERLSEAIRTARQPGKPLSTISAITREAPLASLFVAFLFGVAVARRH